MTSITSIKTKTTQDLRGGGDAPPSQPKVNNSKLCNTEFKEENLHQCGNVISPRLQQVSFISEPDNSRNQHTITHKKSNENKNKDECINFVDESKIKFPPLINQRSKQVIPEPQNVKTVKYKVDDHYLRFIQRFTKYCEERVNLIFDGSIFFDDDFFPRSTKLAEFVPINVIASHIENLELQVPSSTDYCKFAPCGSTLYDYFEDYKAFSHRENVLRNQVNFILNSLQCPRLRSLVLDNTQVDEINGDRYPADRLSTWNDNILSFISRHFKTLKSIQINSIRYKGLSSSASCSKESKVCFPKLNELVISFWDDQSTSVNDSDESNYKNVWNPDRFPDLTDQYWISLMKSQVHGKLRKLCWISAASLSWNDVFQPIIDANKNTLKYLHVMECGGGMLNGSKNRSGQGPVIIPVVAFSTSTMALSCAAFSKLGKLKCLSLRKANSYLTDLARLPKTIEELSIDDVAIKSRELENLTSLVDLRILRLSYNTPSTYNVEPESYNEQYGVNKKVLKELLHSRKLQELCIWGHCLKLNMDDLLENNVSSFNLMAVLDKINNYLTSICNNSQKISPTQLCDWDSQQNCRDKLLLERLGQLGFIDEDGIVIHE